MSARLCLLCLLLCACASDGGERPVVVGSKKFTESVVIGEMARGLAGRGAEHRRELGGTRVLWGALLAGDIDVYPEYSGTIAQEILGGEAGTELEALASALRAKGVVMGAPLGFDNTYAIGMREQRAAALGIRTVSDLAKHPQLRFGFTSEFMDRADGWPGLSKHYGLTHADVRGLDHDLAYRGLASGSLDVTDLYSTDADIQYYGLRVLEDDRSYFPRYQALFLYRDGIDRGAIERLERLAGAIDEPTMRKLNARVKVDSESESAVAASFLKTALDVEAPATTSTRGDRLLEHTLDHLVLVAISLGAAILLAIPLGVLAARRRRLGAAILGAAGVLQTIPSLALLVFMIPLFGIGAPPAICALFLYSLLPIIRNTHAGLTSLEGPVLESATAMGLSSGARLRLVELPLASPAILAGIKTSAVINVGTATLGALIGAGGYGQPILTGIRLDDQALILEGAIPAAALALLVQWGFDLSERIFVPKGLRL
ncbi:MAG: ABC transporter permease subunit [Myxococcales bacterium]|nr:ABC transporter permease subunit [Myxococcales bacterium]